MLRLAGVAANSIVDGPGLRFVLFTQGCPHHCPGCHNPETWPFEGGREMTVVAGASCTTSTPAGGDLSTQAWGISILTGTKWGGVSSTSAVRKEMDADTDDWEEDQPMDVETDEWYE